MCLRWQFLQNSSAVNVCSGITWLVYAICIVVCFVCNSKFYCIDADSSTTRNCKIYPENPNFYQNRRLAEKSRNIAGFLLGFPDPVGKELPSYVASQPRRSQISSTSWRNPEITQLCGFLNTFTATVDLSRFNNSCLKSPTSTLVDLTFQSRALRSFSLNQLRNLSL